MIRDSVRRFAESEIAPRSEQLWQDEEFPYEIWRQACQLGFTGLPYPEAYGGGGGEWLSFAIVLEELARVDCAVANSLMANSTVASLLSNYGTHEQKQRFLRPILDGSQIGAIALSEPNAGSDAANISTRARLDGDRWVIDGSKIFISNSGTDITGPVVIAAVTGMRPDGRQEISNFILPNGTPGFTCGRKLRKIGWRASSTCELFFENCRLPAENLLGQRGAGLRRLERLTERVVRASIHRIEVVHHGVAGAVEGLHRNQRGSGGVEIVRRLESHWTSGSVGQPHFGSAGDRNGIGQVFRSQGERQVGLCGGWQAELNADQLQELEVRFIGDLVDAINQDVREPREELDQRDARIAFVEIGPFRRVGGDAAPQLCCQIFETPIVKLDIG